MIQWRKTEEPDLKQVKALESDPEARDFVYQWTEAQHRAVFDDADGRHWVLETEMGEIVGYCILKGLSNPFGVVELMRIVIGPKNKGYGAEGIRQILHALFQTPHVRKVWLDVAHTNVRGIHLYEKLGFVHEGTLRESALFNGEPVSMRLYGMLRREYEALEIAAKVPKL